MRRKFQGQFTLNQRYDPSQTAPWDMLSALTDTEKSRTRLEAGANGALKSLFDRLSAIC